MTWTKNTAKEEWIDRCGVTAGLPLFESAKSTEHSAKSNQVGAQLYAPGERDLPDWIWTGSGIKAEVYYKMQNKFAEDSLLYLRSIIQLGGKATDHEVKSFFNDQEKWALHIVSARRNYFTGDPYYIIKAYPNKTVIGPRGKPNTIWYVDFTQLYKLIEDKI
jgi:hypothetical protein